MAVGDRFHQPGQPERVFKVFDLDNLFVYMKPDGWAAAPKVVKRWRFAEKGWVRA